MSVLIADVYSTSGDVVGTVFAAFGEVLVRPEPERLIDELAL